MSLCVSFWTFPEETFFSKFFCIFYVFSLSSTRFMLVSCVLISLSKISPKKHYSSVSCFNVPFGNVSNGHLIDILKRHYYMCSMKEVSKFPRMKFGFLMIWNTKSLFVSIPSMTSSSNARFILAMASFLVLP